MIVDVGVYLRHHSHCAALYCPSSGRLNMVAGDWWHVHDDNCDTSGYIGDGAVGEDIPMATGDLCIPHHRLLKSGTGFSFCRKNLTYVHN